MQLTAEDLRNLSRLLDEALAQEPALRDAWIDARSPQEAHLVAALRRALREEKTPTRDGALRPLSSAVTVEAVAQTGELVGPWRLLREIGLGGMGSVWLAERADGNFDRQIALKLPRLTWAAGLAHRMAQERRIGARLEHPNIARLYDAGVDSRARPFIAMEYVDGAPISHWVRDRGLDVRATIRLMLQVVRAVAYAHGRLVVHRDLKPGNVLVSVDGQVHLLDFGIARLLERVDVAGQDATLEHGTALTPTYAAPEQFRGEAVSVQSDVYSLGVMLYELLTGRTPHDRRPDLLAMAQAVLAGDPPLASARAATASRADALRGDVDAIVAKSLRLDMSARYASAEAFADDLERFLRDEPVSAQPDTAVYRLGKLMRRHWLPLSAAALVMVAIVGGTGLAAVQAQRAARASERERLVKDFVADVFRWNAHGTPGRAPSPEAFSRQELLAGDAGLIERRFADQPVLRAELFGTIGQVFADMGAPRVATAYFVKQVDVLAGADAAADRQAAALLSLGRAFTADQRLDDAETRLQRAVALARGHVALEADASLALASTFLLRGQLAPASQLLERVGSNLPPGPSASRAVWLARRAFLLGLDNRFDEAMPLWNQAIDTALMAQGPLSPVAADLRIAIGLRLVQTPRDEEARRYFEPAVAALRALGGVHEVRAALETARYARRRAVVRRHGTAAEALAQIAASRATLASVSLPVPEHFVPLVDFWAAEVRLAQGDLRAALPVVDATLPLLERAIVAPRDRLELANAASAAFVVAGRHPHAERWLHERLSLRRGLHQDRLGYAVSDHVLISSNLSMQGRHVEALAALNAVPVLEPVRGDEPGNPQRWDREIQWASARVHVDAGDGRAALAVLDRSAPEQDESPRELRRYRLLRGAALCTAGRAPDGLPLLKGSDSAPAGFGEHPDSPWRALDRARLGDCALAAGDRDLARRMAALSRSALDAQPEVAPYFRGALATLEGALAAGSRRSRTVSSR